MFKYILLGASLFITNSVNAVSYKLSFGIHDLMVQNIKDDGGLGHIKSGTSHTLGINSAFIIDHQTQNNIKLFAKAEILLEYNKDQLDADHIPLWERYLLKGDGRISQLNKNNQAKWFVFIDLKQNTVSGIEKEVRQFTGIGWQYSQNNFEFETNAYIGFYFIEIDDDTPVMRGYSRNELDDGESANLLEVKGKYTINNNLHFLLRGRYFSANMGFEPLESNIDFSLVYDNFLQKNKTLNFKVNYVKYDFDRFNTKSLDQLPWDNDTLIQLNISMPIF